MADLMQILNWRRQSDRISTSGQPSESQLAEIQHDGVSHIVNLGPHDSKDALDNEPETVAALGMGYTYLPVDFTNPTEADFAAFCTALIHLKDEKIHVHCIYNARVSAFFYRYAKDGRGGSEETAFNLMDGIWRPGGVWAAFIGNTDAVDRPNLYAGSDY